MPWALFSIEAFPSKSSPYEFLRSWGQTIQLEARKWKELDQSYRRWFRRDFKDNTGTVDIAFGEDIAKDLAARYRRRGIVALEWPVLRPEREAKERESQRLHEGYCKAVVQKFELQLQSVRMGKPGPTEPTEHELWCYAELGLPEPASIEAFRDRYKPAPMTVSIVLPPQLIRALQQLPPDVMKGVPLNVREDGSAELGDTAVPKTIEEAKAITEAEA